MAVEVATAAGVAVEAVEVVPAAAVAAVAVEVRARVLQVVRQAKPVLPVILAVQPARVQAQQHLMAAEGTITMIHMAPLATDTGPARLMQGPVLQDFQNTELTVQTDIMREAQLHLIALDLRH